MRYGINNIHWQTIMMDNEQAMITSLHENIPQLNVRSCFFHFGQAIQRWISHNGLQIFYNEEDSTLKVYVGLVRALGLLQVNEVIEGYDLIIRSIEYQNMLRRGEELNLIDNINLLNTYLRRNYINANNIMLWNVYDLNDHRTNNDMEGYHHRLRERFTE
jgi:hypothetical protein